MLAQNTGKALATKCSKVKSNSSSSSSVQQNYATEANQEQVKVYHRFNKEAMPILPDGLAPSKRALTQKRVRNHVNPLTARYMVRPTIPDWNKLWDSLDRPIHLDLGSAKGMYLVDLATNNPNRNFLGMEIREALPIRTNQIIEERVQKKLMPAKNVNILWANSITCEPILEALPNKLDTVSILFPDPQFKESHHKRRLLTPSLASIISKYLVPGGHVYISTDVEEMAQHCCDVMSQNNSFELVADSNWSTDFPVQTDYQPSFEKRGLKIHHFKYRRRELDDKISSE